MTESESKETLLVTCEHCEARVSAPVEGTYEHHYDPPGYSIRYSLLRCPECAAPILASQDDEDARYGTADEDDETWSKPTRMYPEPAKRQLGAAVPEPIRKAFGEAQSCYADARAYTACAIMCRKVLEGVCESHSAKGNSLAARLKDLADRGELDKRLFEWTTTVRMVGNEAAHDVGVTVSRDDASDLLDLAEAVSEYLYTFKEKFEAFERRRKSRTRPA